MMIKNIHESVYLNCGSTTRKFQGFFFVVIKALILYPKGDLILKPKKKEVLFYGFEFAISPSHTQISSRH